MTDPSIVDVLGAFAGSLWMCAAFYFQMIRARSIHPAYVSALFLIGVALLMGSAAVAVDGPTTVTLLAIAGNVLFILLGIGVWYALETNVADT